jgi:hypothetical protein
MIDKSVVLSYSVMNIKKMDVTIIIQWYGQEIGLK